MAIENRPPPDDLSWSELLALSPGSFDFHAALRRFEVSFRDKPRMGAAVRPADEPIRLGQSPSLSFEPTALSTFESADERGPARLAVTFLGLWGPHGALPSHLTEYARDRVRHAGDTTLVSFADIFHHRILLMFHRAWATTQPTVAMDRPMEDAFATYVGAFFGLALPATRHRDSFPDHAKLFYAGQLSGAARNADGLRAIVAEYFGLPTQIEEFVGEWLDLPEDGRWELGVTPATGMLSKTAVLGRRVWTRSQKFRIILGPLGRRDLERMLPTSEAVASLTALVRLYTNDEWAWDLRLVLASDAAAESMALGGGGRLGWTTRIGVTPGGVTEDLIVEPTSRRTRRLPSKPTTR